MASSDPNNPMVSSVEFKAFHRIDRAIYTTLVFYLSRDPTESMQVMAFWLWLEQEDHADDFIDSMMSYPYSFINSLAEEAVFALTCIGNDQFILAPNGVHDMPLTQRLTRNRISLPFLHAQRSGIFQAVTRIAGDICVRAFGDLLQQALLGGQGVNSIKNNHQRQFGNMVNNNINTLMHYELGAVGGPPAGNYGHQGVMDVAPQFAGPSNPMGADPAGASRPVFGTLYDLQALSNEISDALNRITMNNVVEKQQDEEEKEVPADNRTIFLTFSKGYPISEEEVRDFFTRKHGEDCIEAVNMQDVPSDEQPLFARLVVPSPMAIQVILEGKRKAKFTINGKHVWARKYIKKHHRQTSSPPSRPPHGSGPSDPPPPPSAPAPAPAMCVVFVSIINSVG